MYMYAVQCYYWITNNLLMILLLVQVKIQEIKSKQYIVIIVISSERFSSG